MRVEDLLSELEPLSYGERCRRLADLREGAGGSELAELLRELGELGHYERSIALGIAAAVRDEASLAHIRRAVKDQDAELAGRAIGLAAKLGLDGAVFDELLEDAPAAVRAEVYKAIRRWRRRDVAEPLIDRVTARWGDAEGAGLLSAGGTRVAAERLDDLAHAMPSWKSFARAHPGLMLDHAERQLAELPSGVRISWWWRHAPGLAVTVPYSPTRVVGLLERYWLEGPLPTALVRHLGVLMDAEPTRMLAVLLAPVHRQQLTGYSGLLLHACLRRRLVRLDDDDLVTIMRAVRERDKAMTLLLKMLAPSRRDRIFTAAMSGIDLTARELDRGLLEVLPAARRAREAERMLRLRRVAETPSRYWEMTAFLPYDQAAPVLQAVTRRPDAAERAEGYRHLIACAGRSRDPAVLTRLLESLTRLRNEQDPVRQAVINALAAMPPRLMGPVHVPAFAQFVDDAVAARDGSHQTRYALVQLATRVFEQGAIRNDRDLMTFAIEVFSKLTGHMGTVYLRRLDRVLRRGQEHDLVGGLASQLEAEAARDEHRLAFTLAKSLGRRAHQVPALQDALEKALDARSDSDIRQAIGYWLAPPRTRAERVAVILAGDPSTVHLDPVFEVIARRRTDLLHLALNERTPTGRFRRPDVVYVPTAARSWMRHWTSTQRSDYLTLLHRLARAPKIPDAQRANAVRIIGEVPGVSSAELRPYLESSDPYLRRNALTAASWTSSPQAVLADLLALASSDDAHVAMYAATRAARFTVPSALAAALAPVLAEGKITARKEALRLLIHNRVPGAADTLAAAWDDPRQHRDVKAAIVSAARQFLAEPVALRILTEATTGPGILARQVIGAVPLQVEPRGRTTYAELILRVVHSADPEARNAVLPVIPAWAPWAPGSTGTLATIAADLSTTQSWELALRSLLTCAVAGLGVTDLRRLAAELVAAPALPEAGEDRDLPAQQRLQSLVTAVRGSARDDRDGAEPVIRAVCEELPEPLAAELIAATLRWDAPAAAGVLDRLADRPIGGALAIERVARTLADSQEADDTEPELILPHALRLESRGDLTGGLLACALVRQHGPRAGWPPEWRDLLKRLRRHACPDVAYAAGTVHTAAE